MTSMEAATEYVNSVDDANKREYAIAYLQYLVGARADTPNRRCSGAAASAVRMKLYPLFRH
jgi:hypothetical protein